MSGFVNLDIDIVNQHLGQEIEYYELWDPELGAFKRGKSLLHGTYTNENGSTQIYADLIWGDNLDSIFESDGGFCFENGSYIYLGPEPFLLFKLSWLNEFGIKEEKVIPADTFIDVEFTARLFTTGEYQAVRVNLDGSTYNSFTQ